MVGGGGHASAAQAQNQADDLRRSPDLGRRRPLRVWLLIAAAFIPLLAIAVYGIFIS